MKINLTAVNAIKVVQYKVTDYIDGKPKAVDEVICERLVQDKKMTRSSQIALLNSDHLGNVRAVCPFCGSSKCTKDGFYKRNLKTG